MTRSADNDNTPGGDPLGKLPMFATDKQIAVAVVGKGRADSWIRSVLPVLEPRGFPKVDPLHQGRPVALVKLYYDAYLGIGPNTVPTGTDGEEDMEAWTRNRRSRRRG